MHANADASAPTEAGQGAFAALAEIVTFLTNDPDTDWSCVDIDALRKHLVDMNEVTLNAIVEEKHNPNELVFIVTGPPRTAQAIKRMVTAHAAFMDKDTPARFKTQITDDGVALKITNLTTEDRRKFEALGFFGFMATGAHHQPHHLAMAIGQPVHGH